MSMLPSAAHGDTLPVVKLEKAYKGRGEARQEIGSKVTAMLLFDNCAQVPITIAGLDVSKLPSPGHRVCTKPEDAVSGCSFPRHN